MREEKEISTGNFPVVLKHIKRSHVWSSLLLLVCSLVVFIVWAGDEETVKKFTTEDGIVENVTALFFFLGFALCVYRFFRRSAQRRWWLILWAFLCFTFLGEETSWFQRIFGYSTPSVVGESSAQREFNLHNLRWFQGGKWVEALSKGSFNLKVVLSSQNLFRIGFVFYFLIIPLVWHGGMPKGIVRWLRDKINYPLPGTGFLTAIWTTLFLSFLLAFFCTKTTKSSIAETREMFYAIFIFLYLYNDLAPTQPGNRQSRKEAKASDAFSKS